MKTIASISSILILTVLFSSCEKRFLNNEGDGFLNEIWNLEVLVNLKSCDYERVEVGTLTNDGECTEYYMGAIEYYEDGQRSARVDFGPGKDAGFCGNEDFDDKDGDFEDYDGEVEIVECGDGEEYEMEKCGNGRYMRRIRDFKDRDQANGCGFKETSYEKVVVEPLVKAESCEYIVAGTVCFYENEEWVATVDFGNGECDEWATKTTKDGTSKFSQEKKKGDWKKK